MFKCLFALTTLLVTQSTDNDPGGSGDVGDLRYCINSMNTDLNTTPDDFEIVFDFPMTIQLNGILPIINNSPNPVNITIGNSGSIPTVIIDGNSGAYPGFFIPVGNVTIQNMIFQNLIAKGGDGGDGISGGGGGLGAGGAVYAPQTFLNGSFPSITLKNVSINNCSAVGGNGGNYLGGSLTGNEGGGGGGGFAGNGGSITTTGSTGGGGGGGFGGDGGDATLSTDDILGGGGGGGGGMGGNGGSDVDNGEPGSAYGLTITAGSGGGGNTGGNLAGGGGGGGPNGGGGGGSAGANGLQPQGSTPPGGSAQPSGGNGGDGGGAGGGGVVLASSSNEVSGEAGSGGYGGGGGGGAGTGAYDTSYTVSGGSGGVGGGGGGGGVNQSGATPAEGGDSLGGGGGGGGGPTDGTGGSDIGSLGGGSGGNGSSTFGSGGGGGGGGSALGGAIFVDSNLNFTIEALSGVPTLFNTSNNTTTAGIGGTGDTNGFNGSALGDSIFLRSGSSLTLRATDTDDLLILESGVSFIDDSDFGAGGTAVFVRGNGTIVYNGTSTYQGIVMINNANFEVNGQINDASISVCRNISFSTQRGMLSGSGILSGNVYVNSGAISPATASSITLGSLTLNPANPDSNTLGSLVHIEIDSTSTTSFVSVTGAASLAGVLELEIDPNALAGSYIVLTASSITGTFDFVQFTGPTPNYSITYDSTFVQFNFLGFPSDIEPPTSLQGKQKKNDFGLQYEFYNQLTWSPSPSTGVAGYYIYRDGEKIATVNTLTYQDHNRKKGVSYTYSVTAFNSEGDESEPITVVIVPR